MSGVPDDYADWAEDEIDEEFYDDRRHMLAVFLDAILIVPNENWLQQWGR